MNDKDAIAYWKEREDMQAGANEILRARVAQLEGEKDEVGAYCEMLENIVMERGINADFMWKAKRAMEKLEEIRALVEGVNSRSYCDVNWWNEYLEIAEVLDAE